VALGSRVDYYLLFPQDFDPWQVEFSCMRIPLWLKVLWTAWVVVWVPLYYKQYGAQNFLYFCDLGNLLIALALWTESALIFSWQATSLLLFQTLFTIDLVGELVFGKHLIGGTEYMFDANLPLAVRLLSLFHVATPPLLLWAIAHLGYDERGWKLQTLTAWIIVPVNYLWRPQYDVNFARGLFFREQHLVPGPVYLLLYLTVVPLLVYFPTHLLLRRWGQRARSRECKANALSAGT
jgi:hypothetical protein